MPTTDRQHSTIRINVVILKYLKESSHNRIDNPSDAIIQNNVLKFLY